MRIAVDLLQSTGTKGGIESYVRDLYREFGSLTTEHEFIGYLPKEVPDLKLFNWFPGELVRSPYSGENRLNWAQGEMFGVERFARSVNADLIHAPAMLGPVYSKVPVVLTIHDLSYFTHPEFMRNKIFTPGVKIIERLAAQNAKSIIAISQSTAEQIPKFLGKAANAKTTVVLSSGSEVERCRSQVVNRSGRPVFIAMGQRSPYKNLETAILALSLIPKSDRPLLVITGSHGEDPLIPLVNKLELQDDVQLMGWIEEQQLRELMCSSIALIETTIAAGFGMPAVEALKMGVAVISTDIPVFREILSDSALYFEAGNYNDLAKRIKSILDDPDERTARIEAGIKQGAKYSWLKTATETLAVFEGSVKFPVKH